MVDCCVEQVPAAVQDMRMVLVNPTNPRCGFSAKAPFYYLPHLERLLPPNVCRSSEPPWWCEESAAAFAQRFRMPLPTQLESVLTSGAFRRKQYRNTIVGEVTEAIYEVGGDELVEDMRAYRHQFGLLPLGTVHQTKPHKFAQHGVISILHCLPPSRHDLSSQQLRSQLYSTIQHVLERASLEGADAIVLSIISSNRRHGTRRAPFLLAQALVDYVRMNAHKTTLHCIFIATPTIRNDCTNQRRLFYALNELIQPLQSLSLLNREEWKIRRAAAAANVSNVTSSAHARALLSIVHIHQSPSLRIFFSLIKEQVRVLEKSTDEAVAYLRQARGRSAAVAYAYCQHTIASQVNLYVPNDHDPSQRATDEWYKSLNDEQQCAVARCILEAKRHLDLATTPPLESFFIVSNERIIYDDFKNNCEGKTFINVSNASISSSSSYVDVLIVPYNHRTPTVAHRYVDARKADAGNQVANEVWREAGEVEVRLCLEQLCWLATTCAGDSQHRFLAFGSLARPHLTPSFNLIGTTCRQLLHVYIEPTDAARSWDKAMRAAAAVAEGAVIGYIVAADSTVVEHVVKRLQLGNRVVPIKRFSTDKLEDSVDNDFSYDPEGEDLPRIFRLQQEEVQDELDFEGSEVHLGEGNYGEVRKVTFRGQYYAVKRFKFEKEEAAAVEEVRSCIRVAAALESIAYMANSGAMSAAVLRPKFIVWANERPLYVLTDVKQSSLSKKLEVRADDFFATLFHLSKDIALALLHLHQSSLVHRDVKPSNILLEERDEMDEEDEEDDDSGGGGGEEEEAAARRRAATAPPGGNRSGGARRWHALLSDFGGLTTVDNSKEPPNVFGFRSFFSPEIIEQERKYARINDVYGQDVFAYGLSFLTVINKDQGNERLPERLDFKKGGEDRNWLLYYANKAVKEERERQRAGEKACFPRLSHVLRRCTCATSADKRPAMAIVLRDLLNTVVQTNNLNRMYDKDDELGDGNGDNDGGDDATKQLTSSDSTDAYYVS